MFGYVITNIKALSEEERARFRALYCGMCRTLKRRYGNLSRMTLSFDMTFLALVLSALYESEETGGSGRCAAHPFKCRAYVQSAPMEYAADLNVLLAWHKCADDWRDDRSPAALAARRALDGAYRRARARQPGKAKAIEAWMDGIREIERGGGGEIDPPMNLTGAMMGELFCDRDGYWSGELRRMGDALGRFIYFMDAYDDLPRDVRAGKYNPLKALSNAPDFEELCEQALKMTLADCADAFEGLPVVRDANLIRNVLYSGVWSRYRYIRARKEKRKAKREEAQ